jgi:mRNA interferase RelE/StbE
MSSAVYRVVLERPVQKAMEKLPKGLQKRLAHAMQDLANNPRPPGCVQLQGKYKHYRICVGDWRIIYDVIDNQLLILVLEVGKRDSIYKNR